MSDTLTTVAPVQESIELATISPVKEIVTTIPLPVEIIQPEWLQKITRKQIAYNERYEKAHEALSDAFQDFMSEIDAINHQFGTTFDLTNVVRDFEGKELIDSKL